VINERRDAMRNRLLLFVLCALVLQAGPALAQPTPDIKEILRALGPATTVPPEWDGIWETTDSIFTCTGGLEDVSTGADTLCARAEIPPPMGINYDCTGTADATTVHLTCTIQYDPYPNCHANSLAEVDGTRTGDIYYFIAISNTTFSGSGFGCRMLPPQCSIIHIRGVRTGQAPLEYCATPTHPTTWGAIKMHYR